MEKPELLAPAGDFEKLKVAISYGADAVYTGLKEFSLRANTKNFDEPEFISALNYVHNLNKKIYIAANIYIKPSQIEGYIENLKFMEKVKPDGLIISDPGGIYLAKKYCPSVPIHVSTQANTINQYAVRFYQEIGVKRIVLARELSLKDIDIIRTDCPDIELECFIHGAMCIAYSGRCLLSSYMTTEGLGKRPNDKSKDNRSANSGDCSHSCRWEFILKEKTRPDQNYEITENDNGTYILSSKDICMIDHLGDLMNAGINSFKIEGRMKSILYISSIVRAYRNVLDNKNYDKDMIKAELDVVSHREFSTGYFFDKPMENANITGDIKYKREKRLVGLVTGVEEGKAIVKVYNSINPIDVIEYISKDMKTVKVSKIILFDKNNQPLDKATHSLEYVKAIIYDEKGELIDYNEFDILRINYLF